MTYRQEPDEVPNTTKASTSTYCSILNNQTYTTEFDNIFKSILLK
ncbi:hypothetical protein JOC34_004343 [Virgibacillus halotolerans]|nr:hypothetical protein [Virgibacillus halotolerans]